MAAGLHANVGLMHATMAIYNAFCDRVPMLILGATGPLDAEQRRPWIDWLHTATDQAALIRPFIKFDDQPHSPNAAIESLLHATVATSTKPCAPAYICLDLSLQENEVDPKTLHFPETSRYLNFSNPGPSQEDVSQVVELLEASKRPLILLGRMDRSEAGWKDRIRLAERYEAKVITDIKQACSFPTNHRLHAAPPGLFVPPQTAELIRSADLIIAFDWVDLAGALKGSYGAGVEPTCKVVQVSLDSELHNGWSKDHFGMPPTEISIRADTDKTISALLSARNDGKQRGNSWQSSAQNNEATMNGSTNLNRDGDIFMTDLANALYSTISPDNMCLVRVPLSWKGVDLQSTHPLAFMVRKCGYKIRLILLAMQVQARGS